MPCNHTKAGCKCDFRGCRHLNPEKCGHVSKYATPEESKAAMLTGIIHNSGPLMYIGGGPWMLSPDCTAQWHNTQRAAVGKARNRPGVKCECPRALHLLEASAEKANKRKRRQRAEAAAERATRPEKALRQAVKSVEEPNLMEMLKELLTVEAKRPDLRGGSCSSLMGRKLADAVTTSPLPAGAYSAHRAMCGGCPVKLACAAWSISDEGYPSSKEGMWGGMSASERRKARSAALALRNATTAGAPA